MFGLIPKEKKFFEMFKAMAGHIVNGAALLNELITNFESIDIQEIYNRIKDVEHLGDTQTHDIIRTLDKSFITPFDREDIYDLAAELDNVLDVIDASAKTIVSYNIKSLTNHAHELTRVVVESCSTVAEAITCLGNKPKFEHITEYCVKINFLENEADTIRQNAISHLFAEEKNAIEIIKFKDIYKVLELVTDMCENVANILESLVLKNA